MVPPFGHEEGPGSVSGAGYGSVVKRSLVLVLSLLLNVVLLAAGGWYLAERGARPIAEDLGVIEERRPAYGVYAEERFTGLEGEPVVLIGDSQIERGPSRDGSPVLRRAGEGARRLWRAPGRTRVRARGTVGLHHLDAMEEADAATGF